MRTRAEGLDLLVEQRADARHLRATHPQPERLHQLVDAAGRDATHVGLLDDRHQRLLGAPARPEKAREVAALTQLRDLQIDLAGARVPPPRAVAVAVRGAVLRPALAELGADQLGHLDLHQLPHEQLERLAQHVGMLVEQHLPHDLLSRHPVLAGHQWCLLVVEPSRSPTMVSAAVAGTTTFRPPRSYTTLWDVTAPAGRRLNATLSLEAARSQHDEVTQRALVPGPRPLRPTNAPMWDQRR
jgi:hypothetical protein